MLVDLGLEDLAQHAVHRGGRTLARFDHVLPGHGFDGRNGGDRGHRSHRGGGRVERFLAGGDALGHRLHRVQVGDDAALPAQRRIELRQHLASLPHHRQHRRARRPGAVEHAVEHPFDLPAEFAQRARADQAATALEGVEHAADRTQPLKVLRRFLPVRDHPLQVGALFLEFLQEHLADVRVDVGGGIEAAHRRHLRGPCRGTQAGGGGGDLGDDRTRRRVQFDMADTALVDLGRTHVGLDLHAEVDPLPGIADRGHLQRRIRIGTGLAIPCGIAGFGAHRVEPDPAGGNRRCRRRDGFRFDRHRLDLQARHCQGLRLRRSRFERPGRDIVLGGDRIPLHGGRSRGCDHDRHGRGGCTVPGIPRQRRLHIGQRPVVQAFQAVARDLQDLVAVGPAVAQRLQVVLQTGHCIGQGVELATAGHAPALQQLGGDVATHAFQVIGRLGQIEDAQRTGHFRQQARHVGQAAVVPVGLDEGDEVLAGGGEIGDRLVRQHLHRAPGLGGGGFVPCILAGRAQARDLVVQRGVHVEQRAGDVQQRALAGRLLAAGDGVERVALLEHDFARHPQAKHAEGVGHVGQFARLRLQRGGIAAGTQVQVERVLHPQQLFLDHPADGIEQVAIAPGQAAAGMVEFGFAGRVRVQFERLAQRFQRRMRRVRLRDQVQQLAGRLLAGHALVGVGGRLVPVRLAHRPGDAREGATQGFVRSERAVAQGLGGRGQHPQHAPGGVVTGILQQRGGGSGQPHRILRCLVFRPRRQRLVELCLRRGQPVVALGPGQRRGFRYLLGQGPAQIRGEQHALVEPGRAARGAQIVEQRQQHDRDVAVAVLQSFQVVGQQHGAAHQGGAGLVAIAGPALLQHLGEQLHFLGDHRRRIQLDHAQAALHLVQVAGAEAHAAGIGRILDEGFDLVARLAQGLVQLRLDPAQHCMAHRVAQCAHRRPPSGRTSVRM